MELESTAEKWKIYYKTLLNYMVPVQSVVYIKNKRAEPIIEYVSLEEIKTNFI